MPTSDNFPSEFRVNSVNTSKILSVNILKIFRPKKGFALPLILITLLIVLSASVGILYYYQSAKNKEEAKTDLTLCAKAVENMPTNTQESKTEGKVSKSSLLAKMGNYTNYQLNRTQKFTSLNRTVQSKFIRAGDKLATFAESTPLIGYSDVASCKEYILSPSPQGNEFIDSKDLDYFSSTIREMFELGTPQYYLKRLPDELAIKPDEKFNDKIVNVYEGINSTSPEVPFTVFIYKETGLPAKIISINIKTNVGITQEFIFSRIGEVQESEVVVPISAKKISKKQYDKAGKMLDEINKDKN